MTLLSARDVTKRFDTVEVLRGVSFELAARETLAIVGPSGSGKSTLLQLLGTLDRPTSGTVTLAGRDLSTLDDAALSKIRRTELGFVFQRHHLLPQLTALENVLAPTLAWPKPERAAAVDRARSLLERVGLSPRLDHRPGQLSGGECQRVALARALIAKPKLLLADEPTGALDRASSESITDLLLAANREDGVALVVVTHAERLAARMSRTLAIEDGRFVG